MYMYEHVHTMFIRLWNIFQILSRWVGFQMGCRRKLRQAAACHGPGSRRAGAQRPGWLARKGPGIRVLSRNLTTWLILVYTGIYLNVLCTSWVIRCYRITQYENQAIVCLSMKFSDKVYTRIYWVHACIYFTADCWSWLRGHILGHTRTSEHIQCATALFLPAPCRPVCTLLACLHPAGALDLKAAHSLQEQDTLGQEQICLLLCQQLPG